MKVEFGMVFVLLLLAHLLYDFHWQGEFIAQNKGKYALIMGVHVVTWTLIIVVVLWVTIGRLTWWQPIFLFVTHWITDSWKASLPREIGMGWPLWVDQGIHLSTLVIVWLLAR